MGFFGPGRIAGPESTWEGFPVLRTLRERFERDDAEEETRRLRKRFEAEATVPIVDAPTRVPIEIAGEVQAVQVRPHRRSPFLELTVRDGTGRAVVVFTGRRRIGGIEPGRALRLRGVGRIDRGRLVLLNPAYTLLP